MVKRAWLPFVATTGVYIFFSALLARDGHAPSVALLPIPKAGYYAMQAAFVLPVFGCACLAATASARLAIPSRPSLRDVILALFPALTLPTLLFFLLPELSVYAVRGFEGLKDVVRFTTAITGLATLVALALAVRKRFIVTHARALLVAVVALLTQAVIASPFLR